MKLRIRGNSIRLRIQRQELETLRATGMLSEALHLGPGNDSTFRYMLAKTSGQLMEASFKDGLLRVGLPEDWITEWASTDRVGWDTELDTGAESTVRVMVEKDFPCIVDRLGEDDSDAFPASNGMCGSESKRDERHAPRQPD